MGYTDEFDKGVTFSTDLLLRDDHGLERYECATISAEFVSRS